ncbi:MAG: FAD-dependent oxidoreductase [Parasporobacterium sp.]|nr:FAD-dependent oxidoreductase [Parasporobacterium sp.]
MDKYAVIGIGCAGYNAVKSMRENGFIGEIHIYSDVSHPSANPMLTTYYVSGRLPREGMFPFGSLEKLVKDYNVILHTDTRVRHVNASEKQLVLEDGSSEVFDKILIAAGARAVSPPLGQKPKGRCFLMRSVEDADRLKQVLEQENISSAAVVGASMTGIKVTELLAEKNISVTMIDMADRLFPLACMKETADILEKDLTGRGIRLLLRTGVDHVEENGNDISTFLTDGSCVSTDILVLCIGTRANTELAANTEVLEKEPVLINRGIVVDEHMQTSVPGIFAAGDCCEALNIQTGSTMIIGLWANAAEQGRIAGCCMAADCNENSLPDTPPADGSPSSALCSALPAYKGSIPNNITHYFDQTFVGIGDPNLTGERFTAFNKSGMVSAIHDGRNIKCINILGNYRISGMVKDYLIKRITGQGAFMAVADMGLLRNSGVPEEFIQLLKN